MLPLVSCSTTTNIQRKLMMFLPQRNSIMILNKEKILCKFYVKRNLCLIHLQTL